MKTALVIFSNLQGAGSAHARTALEIAKELRDAGEDISIIFDGAGVETAALIAQEDSDLYAAYKAVEDSVLGACAFCVKTYKVTRAIENAGIPLLTGNHGHSHLQQLKGWETGYYVLELKDEAQYKQIPACASG